MANIRKDQTNLEKLRRAKGMTRQDLADATGLTWDKLRSYEIKRSSIKNLPLKHAIIISDILECNVQDLLNEVPNITQIEEHGDIVVPTRKDPIQLEKLRSQKGLTRKDLAQITGISYPTLQLYEQKRSSIEKITLWKALLISKALGCEAWELLDECPY